MMHIFDRNTGIEEPKTDSGKRTIPMTDEVYECFKRILENRKAPRIEPMIDGYTGFLFLDMNNKPTVALHWQHYIKRIVEKYNGIYKTPLPEITPHVCRHTYCSNMAKSGMNPKTLQYLMGHADISVTLNTYTHVSFEGVKEDVLKVVKPQLQTALWVQCRTTILQLKLEKQRVFRPIQMLLLALENN